MPEPPDEPPDEASGDGRLPRARSRRPALWLLLVPAVLYCAAPLLANRIEPRILGVPFLLAWILAATVLSPLVIWVAARLDPAYRTGAVEPLPVDDREAGAPQPGPGDSSGPNTGAGGV